MSINELFVETPKEKIESFIKSLHPIKTEHELVRLGQNMMEVIWFLMILRGLKRSFLQVWVMKARLKKIFIVNANLQILTVYIYGRQIGQ
nr:hypothetical protein [Helicobacter pylori]